MKSRILVVTLLLTLSAVFPSGQILADSEAFPEDYAIVSDDGEFIFVMLVSDEEEIRQFGEPLEDDWLYESRVFKSQNLNEPYRLTVRAPLTLRRKYPCSGLYKNDGTITPIWTVNWYAYTVYLYPDMQHLVRRGPWHRRFGDWKSFDGLAYAFYKNGMEFAKFQVKDVVKYTDEIRISVSHYRWEEKMLFDSKSGIFTVTTADHATYEYDLRRLSGSVVGQETACTPNSQFVEYSNRLKNLPGWLSILILGSIMILARFIRTHNQDNYPL